MDPKLLTTSVLSKTPKSLLIRVSSQLRDGQVLTGKDLSLTSYANHPDIYGVEIRKGTGDTLYEYPIFMKGSASANKVQNEIAQPSKNPIQSQTTGMFYKPGINVLGKAKTLGPKNNPISNTPLKNWGDFSNPEKKPSGAGSSWEENKPTASVNTPAEDDTSWGDIAAEAGLLWGNVASIATSTVPVYGTAASGILGATTDIAQFAKNIHDDGGYKPEHLKQLGMDLGTTGVGLIPFGGGASAKFAVKAPIMAQKAIKLAAKGIKGLSWVLNTAGASEQGYNAIRQLQEATLRLQKDPTDMEAYKTIVSALTDAAKGTRSWKTRNGAPTNATAGIPLKENGGKILSRYSK